MKQLRSWYFFFGCKWNFFWMWLPLINTWKKRWDYWKPSKEFNLRYTE